VTASRGPLPDAAHLELVRRLAQRGGPFFDVAADRALRRSGPGRGPVHLTLVWPDSDRSAAGPGAPPVDPAALPAEELIRAGTGLLADLVLSVPAAAASQAPPRPPRRRPWRPAFHLAGAPVTTAGLRAALAAAGHHEGGRRPRVLLVAEPLDVALAQVWSTRVQRGAPVRWATFAARWAHRDQLPPSADLAAIARFWAGRLGAERVHVLTPPAALRSAADVLGTDAPQAVPAADPRELSPAAVDLLRRLNGVLNVRVEEARHRACLRRLAALLPRHDDLALAVPAPHRDWLDERWRRITDELTAGGYSVLGDLARAAPRHHGASHPRGSDVLDLVLETCLHTAALTTAEVTSR
jgi:hypothetical protein